MTKCNDLLTCPFGHIHCFVSLNDQMFCGSEVVSVLLPVICSGLIGVGSRA